MCGTFGDIGILSFNGNKIITSGGIIGTINKVADNRELQVQVSENVEIKDGNALPLKNIKKTVHVWTVNSKREAENYVHKGIDTITTNKPLYLRNHLEQLKLS